MILHAGVHTPVSAFLLEEAGFFQKRVLFSPSFLYWTLSAGHFLMFRKEDLVPKEKRSTEGVCLFVTATASVVVFG